MEPRTLLKEAPLRIRVPSKIYGPWKGRGQIKNVKFLSQVIPFF